MQDKFLHLQLPINAKDLFLSVEKQIPIKNGNNLVDIKISNNYTDYYRKRRTLRW